MVSVYGECWTNVGVKGCQRFVTLSCKLLCLTIYNFCIRLFENIHKHKSVLLKKNKPRLNTEFSNVISNPMYTDELSFNCTLTSHVLQQ